MIVKMICLLPLTWIAAINVQAEPADIRKAVCDATISINPNDSNRRSSGVVIGTKDSIAYALTAQHVVADAKKLEVIAQVAGKPKTFSGVKIVWSDEQTDLALVCFDAGTIELASVKLGECDRHMKDFPVLKSSWKSGDNPDCLEDQAIKRILRKAPKGNAFFWQTKGTSEPGDSGGGMFGSKGELLGICSGNQDGFGYFTSGDEIYFALKKHSSSSFLAH